MSTVVIMITLSISGSIQIVDAANSNFHVPPPSPPLSFGSSSMASASRTRTSPSLTRFTLPHWGLQFHDSILKSNKQQRKSSSTMMMDNVDSPSIVPNGNIVNNRLWNMIHNIRGGATEDDEEDEEEDDEDYEDEDDDDVDGLGFDDDIDESEFSDINFVGEVFDAWKKTPPVTRGYLSLSLASTLLGFFTNQNQFPQILSLDVQKLFTRLQIWRPFTCFLHFGPFGLMYLITAQFVWQYMSTLESLCHDRPYDFWIMTLFGQVAMVCGYLLTGLNSSFLGHNLSTYFVYVWSRYHEGVEVNVFGLFNAHAEHLPWLLLLQTYLLEGEIPILDLSGIIFGHIYHHYKSVGVLNAPKSLIEWYKGDNSFAKRIRSQYKSIAADFEVQLGDNP